MLDKFLTFNFKEADGTTDRSETFDKKSEDANLGVFNNHQNVVDRSLPIAQIVFSVADPKPTTSFYGVVKNQFTIRHEADKAVPGGGTTLQPIIEKVTTSCPVVFTLDERKVQLNRFRAIINSDAFRDFYLEGHC
jgi:hypothetical protein